MEEKHNTREGKEEEEKEEKARQRHQQPRKEEEEERQLEQNEFSFGGHPLCIFSYKESVSAERGLALPSKSTGTKLWPAATVLSTFLANRLPTLHQPTLLELGAGLGLCGLLAGAFCSKVVLTDKDEQVLRLLQLNISTNYPEAKHIECAHLTWGVDLPAFTKKFPQPFDIIIASDVLYYYSAVEAVWKTVDHLLSRTKNVYGETPAFYVAHVNRDQTIEKEIQKVAKSFGFVWQIVPLNSLFPSIQDIPSSEHVRPSMLRMFVFMRQEHLHT
jgi:predicted nicotinamide N-methyase